VPMTMTLAQRNSDFKIVTDQKSLNTFFSAVYGSEAIIYLPPYPNYKWYRKIAEVFAVIKYKQKLKSLLPFSSGNTIYFFYNAFGFNISWWLGKISHNNKLLYLPDVDISMWPKTQAAGPLIKSAYFNFLYNAGSIPVKKGNFTVFAVSDEFLLRNNVQRIEGAEIDWSIIKEQVNKKYSFSNKQVLLLGGCNTVEDNFVDEKEFTTKNDALIECLAKDKVVIKVHPRFSKLISREKEIELLPSEIPANVLLDQFDIVIGYASSVSYEAVNRGKTAISLLKYFVPTSNKLAETYIEYLKTNSINKQKLFFPETLEEIKSILNKNIT